MPARGVFVYLTPSGAYLCEGFFRRSDRRGDIFVRMRGGKKPGLILGRRETDALIQHQAEESRECSPSVSCASS